MSDLYAIGLSGTRAYQGALATVSENIANAQTAGYTKRVVTLKEHGATSGGVAGSGVYIGAVVRTADAYRAADVRRSGADLARSETAVQWLEQIETAIDSQSIGQRITGFYNSATTLAADPSAITPRAQMIEAANGVAVSISTAGNELERMSGQLDASAAQGVGQLNGLTQTLAKVNDGLTRTQPGTVAHALLADQRDNLLGQMSALVDATASFDDFGRATVRMGGSTGPVLVAPGGAGVVSFARNSSGAFQFSINRGVTDSAFAPAGGMLAGVADSAQRIGDARTALGVIAKDFADTVNAFQTAGRDLDGTAGPAIFTYDSGDPTKLTVTLDDPRKIAAASPGGGTRDNSNLIALGQTRASGKFEGRVTALVGGNATALSAARTVASAQTAIREGALARYDATAGVDIDNEAVDLMRFQQAYQASARVIQVGRECFQSLIQSV